MEKMEGGGIVWRLEKAKWVSRSKYPYLARIVSVLSPAKEVPELKGPLAVDKGGRLYWRSDLLARLSDEDLVPLIVHEALHLLLRHFGRRGDREVELWNVATDMEINDDLQLPPSLQEKAVVPSRFGLPDGQPAEWYYEKLAEGQQGQRGQGQQRQEQGVGEEGQGGGDEGRKQEEGQGQGRGKGREKQARKQGQGGGSKSGDKEQGEGSGAGGSGKEQGGQGAQQQDGQQLETEVGVCGGGSGVTGVPEPWELPTDDAQTPALTEGEIEDAIRGVAEDMREYARQRGTLPGWARRFVDEWEAARSAWRKVNWERLVQRVVSVEGSIMRGRGTATDWRRRNKRFSESKFVIPAKATRIPKVLIVVDTSGSMRGEDLQTCLAGIEKGLKSFGGRLKVAAWDASLQGVKEVTSIREVGRMLKGGGGTSMKRAIEWAESQVPVLTRL